MATYIKGPGEADQGQIGIEPTTLILDTHQTSPCLTDLTFEFI
jgi:hypothetical protein